jgi:hypothetical protein
MATFPPNKLRSPTAPKPKAIANLSSFHFDQSAEVIALSDDFLLTTKKALDRLKIDASYMKDTTEAIAKVSEAEVLLAKSVEFSDNIKCGTQNIREKVYTFLEISHEHDLRMMRDETLRENRKVLVNERVIELEGRRKLVRKYIQRETKKIDDHIALQLKKLEAANDASSS